MAYQRGFLKDRITILNRQGTTTASGAKQGSEYVADGAPIWANVSYLKGKKAMMEASLDAISSYLVRCDYNVRLTGHSRVQWKGKVYQIDPPKSDEQKNEMQFIMYEQP